MVTIAGSVRLTVCRPPSTSRVTSRLPAPASILYAKVPCGQPSSAPSIWPVWFESSSIACLPRMTSSGPSRSTTAFRSLATASGSQATSVFTRIARSAPIASAVRSVSCAACGPIDTATISLTVPFSFRRIASSTAISSNGFIDIFTFASSTPEPSAFTRILTL